jgi:AbrB family looped-hinge helix DNA binding protein
MALVKVRQRAQITLPAEVCRALDVGQGDYLETEITEKGVLLKPAGPLDRSAARARLMHDLRGESRWIGPGAEPTEDEVMEMVVEEIEDTRRRTREGRPR